MYRLSLSGGFALVDGEGVDVPLKSAKARALLAFLATSRGNPRTREEIMALLWSDRGEAQARASLRQVLSGLRKAFGVGEMPVKILGEALSLDPDHVCVEEGSEGVFLAGLNIRDPAFEDWVRDERLRRETGNGVAQIAAPPDVPDMPSVAVLPFDSLSDAAEQGHFAAGMTQDIITALSKLPKLFVVARESTSAYRGDRGDVVRIGREQGVRYVLDGSIRREASRLRISVQLIDVASGRYIWAERYDRKVASLFDLQDEITREVASALQVEITEGDQARLWASGTTNREAWECIAQVTSLLFGHRRAEVLKGRALTERALALDEGYGSAWVWLGWSHVEEVFNGWSEDPERSLAEARRAGERAREIDACNPEAFVLLGFAALCARDFDAAETLTRQGIALGPNNAFAYGVAACIGQYRNEPDAMIPLLVKAKRLCPIYPAWYAETLGWAYLLKRRHRDAIACARDAVARDPDYIYSYIVLAVACSETGRMGEAREAVADILRIEPGFTCAGFARTQPFQDADVLERHVAGLRAAGLTD